MLGPTLTCQDLSRKRSPFSRKIQSQENKSLAIASPRRGGSRFVKYRRPDVCIIRPLLMSKKEIPLSS